MASRIRNTLPQLEHLVTMYNELKAWTVAELRLAQADVSTATGAGTSFTALGFHNDRSESTVDKADATDLPTSLALTNQILAIYKFHLADTLAHKVTGTNVLTSYAVATDLTSAIARANDIKAKYNLHRASTVTHYTADSTNTIATADATNQSSLNTLLNDIKAKLNAHMASGPTARSLRLIGA